MDTVFGSSPVRTVVQQENNIAARKAASTGISTRKPLTDIKIGEDVTPKAFGDKSAQKIDEVDEFGFDICSYKDVPDNFDIMDPAELNHFSSVLFGRINKTPRPENLNLEPDLIEPKAFNDKIVDNEIFGFDICSYKDVPDNYNDIMGPAELSHFSSILFDRIEKTPPPAKKQKFNPELIEMDFNYHFLTDEIFTETDFEDFGLDDAPLPDPVFEF